MNIYDDFLASNPLAGNPLVGRGAWFLIIAYSLLAFLTYSALCGGFDGYVPNYDEQK